MYGKYFIKQRYNVLISYNSTEEASELKVLDMYICIILSSGGHIGLRLSMAGDSTDAPPSSVTRRDAPPLAPAYCTADANVPAAIS